jgi:hypothetical protein
MRNFQFFAVLASLWLLAGCSNTQPITSTATRVEVPVRAQTTSYGSIGSDTSTDSDIAMRDPRSVTASTSASVCQRELTALAGIDKRLYTDKKAAFDALLASASTYIAVRGDIDMQTRESMDALYKYRTQKMCGDINRTVQQALMKQGENFR